MNIQRIIKLLDIYANCPRCANEMLGEKEGNLEITENTFTRECFTCGFKVKIEEFNADK